MSDETAEKKKFNLICIRKTQNDLDMIKYIKDNGYKVPNTDLWRNNLRKLYNAVKRDATCQCGSSCCDDCRDGGNI